MEPVFDPILVAERKRRALTNLVPGADFLLARANEELIDRLSTVKRDFARVAVAEDPTGTTAALLRRSGKIGDVEEIAIDRLDGERLPGPPATLDLIVSLYALHEINDLPGMLAQMRRRLKPDGLLLACLSGSGTLVELRDSLLAAEIEVSGGASPRVAPFADIRDLGGLLQRAGLALPVADVDEVTVRYDTVFHLMQDLRAMGSTSSLAARARVPASRRLFARAAEIYAERYSDPDGRIRATFATIWISGWAPHASQQKPLPPGSAEVALADALRQQNDNDPAK